VSAYLNGSTAGHSGDHERKPGARDRVKGWSSGAVRRHTKWLYSIDAPELGDNGFAVTLTVRDCPESAADWLAARKAFIRRLEASGLVRYHWLTEWQRRGVPHLHGAFYFAAAMPLHEVIRLVIAAWFLSAGAFNPGFQSQDVKAIEGATGWLKYLSKHASRGVRHYQRMGHPEGWETTGRLWGYGGSWPVEEPMQFDLVQSAGYRYRRLVRAWTIADARKSGDPKRIAWARGMLRCNDPKLSTVRGVSGWVPESVTLGFIALLLEQGEGVIQRAQVQDPTPTDPQEPVRAEAVAVFALRD
jgi:hypothetical protein